MTDILIGFAIGACVCISFLVFALVSCYIAGRAFRDDDEDHTEREVFLYGTHSLHVQHHYPRAEAITSNDSSRKVFQAKTPDGDDEARGLFQEILHKEAASRHNETHAKHT